MKKVKTILVSQPEPKNDNSPYFDLEKKLKVKIDFRPFVEIQGVTPRDVRHQKIDFSNYTAVILTSRNAVDHYFRLAEEMRFQVPIEMKYFCISEAVAYYLQNYIVYRKRKIYVGERTIEELGKVISKFGDEKFLLPTSDRLKPNVTKVLNGLKIDWDRAILFKTVMSDLSDLENVFYDILVFFSPTGIESLYHNFPNFKQNDTRIAVYGAVTKKAAEERGLTCNIVVPTPENTSMTAALENYIREANKRS